MMSLPQPLAARRFFFQLGMASLIGLSALGTACSTAPTRPEPGSEDPAVKAPTQAEINQLKEQMTALSTRLESMETKISSIGDKLQADRSEAPSAAQGHKPVDVPVGAVASQELSAHDPSSETPPAHRQDPEAGFVQDAAVSGYRQAMILFRAEKYPEAVLAFSSFLERYADHPLAGAAQYYIGESYFRQKEYKLAAEELQRVLTSYDRSSHVPNALLRLAEAEAVLSRADESAKHRQMLLALFPHSPSAAQVETIKTEQAAPRSEQAPPQAVQPEPTTPAHAELSGGNPNAGTLDAAPESAPPTAPLGDENGNE